MSGDLSLISSLLHQASHSPEKFLEGSSDLHSDLLRSTKSLYDSLDKDGYVEVTEGLKELHLEGFEDEQIWSQIELRNQGFLNTIENWVKEMSETLLKPKSEESEEENTEKESITDWENIEEKEVSDMDEDDVEEDLSDVDEEEDENEMEEASSDPEEDQYVREDSPIKEALKENDRRSGKRSIVDDDFFSLEDMNKFVEQAEKDEANPNNQHSDSDESINLFQDLAGGSSEIDIQYQDFFDPPKKVRFNIPEDHEEDEEADENEDQESEDANPTPHNLFEDDMDVDSDQEKSTYQKKMEKMNSIIEELEQENIQDKSWTLKGEASSKQRPLNSLLEEDLEFDHAGKPVPVITEEITQSLEDIIKQRILAKQFDDVVRILPSETKPFKPREEISQEKSSRSLTEIYEEDYLKSVQKDYLDPLNQSLNQQHEEINLKMKKLFVQLDALSHFQFTPNIKALEAHHDSDAEP